MLENGAVSITAKLKNNYFYCCTKKGNVLNKVYNLIKHFNTYEEEPIIFWITQFIVGVLFLAFGLFVNIYIESHDMVTVVRPEIGLGLAALIITGWRSVVGVFVGSLILFLMLKYPLWLAFGISFANIIELGGAYYLLFKYNKSLLFFDDISHYLKLVFLGGGVASFVGSVIACVFYYAYGEINSWKIFAETFFHWIMGDMLGVSLITALVLAWAEPDFFKYTKSKKIEGIVLIILTFIVGQIVFIGWFSSELGEHTDGYTLAPQGYLMMLFIAWVALRMGPREVMAVMLIISTQGLFSAFMRIGYFADDISKSDLHNYWLYMMITSGIGMVIAINMRMIKSSLDSLNIKDRALNAAANSIVITDRNGNVEWANKAMTKLSGYELFEMYGKNTSSLVKSGKHDKYFYIEMWRTILDKKTWQGEVINRRKDGSLCDEEMIITPLVNEFGEITHFIAVKQDITDRKKIEERIRQFAFYDELTKLPNRRLLNDRLGQAVITSKRTHRFGALMFLDLDNFKPLNDIYGHAAGDALLIEAATRLKNCVREVDTPARFGGDEFVVMLNDLGLDYKEAFDKATIVGNKILQSLSSPYLIQLEGGGKETVEHHCTASIGVAMFVNGIQSVFNGSHADILRWADIAMYKAKEGGKNQVIFFDIKDEEK